MIPPIRCYTCGKVIVHMFGVVEASADKPEMFRTLGVTRDCCKRMLLTHVDLADRLIAPAPPDDAAHVVAPLLRQLQLADGDS